MHASSTLLFVEKVESCWLVRDFVDYFGTSL